MNAAIERWPGVRLESHDDRVVVLILDAPARLNAIDDEMLIASLPAALDRIRALAPRAVVLAGEGRAFCAGVDLRSKGFAFEDREQAARFLRDAHRIPIGIRELGVPVLGAVQGAAVGAGLGLALAADLRFAGTAASFSAPFASLGLVPDFGVSYFLPRCVGLAMALDMTLTGRRVGAEEALASGLVSRLVEEPREAALDAARRIAAMAPVAIGATRANVYAGPDLTMEEALLEREPDSQAEALCGPEFRRIFERHRREVFGDDH